MLFDDPACFRLDRIPVRPIRWLWRPYLACGKLALLDGEAGAVNSPLAARVLHADAGADHTAPRRRRPAWAEGRPSNLAVVEFDLAARRPTTPMGVRPTDPCRAPCRPYGLARGETEAMTERAATVITVASCRLLLSLIAVDLINDRANGVQPTIAGRAQFNAMNRSRLVSTGHTAAKTPDVFFVRPFERLEHHFTLRELVL